MSQTCRRINPTIRAMGKPMGVPGSGQDQAIIHRRQGAVFSAGGSAGGLMAVRRVITGPRADITEGIRDGAISCALIADAPRPALTSASRGRPGSRHVGMDRAAMDGSLLPVI